METIKNTSELKMVAGFSDDDTRTLIADNPRDDLTVADIKAVESKMITNQPIVGDKGGADFTGFISVKVVNKTRISFDV